MQLTDGKIKAKQMEGQIEALTQAYEYDIHLNVCACICVYRVPIILSRTLPQFLTLIMTISSLRSTCFERSRKLALQSQGREIDNWFHFTLIFLLLIYSSMI